MLSKEETQHIARLARLGLSDEEITKYQKDLSDILGYVDKLKQADVGNASPFTHSVRVVNVLRPDAKTQISKDNLEKLTKQMPQTRNNYLKVKAIL